MFISLKENETMQDLIERLSESFELVYGIAPVAFWYENLNEDGRIKDIHFSDRMREMLGYESFEDFPDDINTLMTHTHPDDVHIMLDDAVNAGMGKKDRYDVQFRIRKADGGYLWCNATGELVKDHNGKSVGMYGAFIDVTEEVELRDKQENDRKTREVINGFSEEYDAAFYGNISEGTYQTLTNVNVVASKVDEIVSFEDAMKSYVSNFVHPEDAVLFDGEYTGLSVAEKNIPVGESKTFEYRSRTGGDYAWYKAMLRRITENELLVGFKNCDSEIVGRHVADKLMSEYDIIYVADLNRSTIRSAGVSGTVTAGTLQGKTDYREAMLKYAETVLPKYKPDWISFSDTVYMKQYMKKDDHREYVYELSGTQETMRRFSIDVLERAGKEASLVLFSIMRIDDERANAIRLHRQIAEQQQALADHRKLLDYFVDQYWSACFIDLNNDTLEVLRANNANASAYIMDGTHEDMERFIDSHFHPDDKELMLTITDKDFVRKELKDKASISYVVREIIEGSERTMRVLIVRGADENHVAVGFMDITEEVLEQQKHLLGAIPLSSDVLTKAGIGMWAFELDEGQPPRMYVDEAMLGLIGLSEQVPPEQTYHAWYDHVDENSLDLVNDAVSRMTTGEHVEVQYPWHHPDGRTMAVRCGGVRNFEYTKGIRIEGTHQDVTETIHYDEEERKRNERQRIDLIKSRLRAEALSFLADNEPDFDKGMDFFGKRILEILGCEQFIYHGTDGYRIVVNAPGIKNPDYEVCDRCPFAEIDSDVFGEEGVAILNDCRMGYNGVTAPETCPAKSSYMQRVYTGDKLEGLIIVNYLNDYHTFTEDNIDVMNTVVTYCGLLMGKINEKKAEMEKIAAESSNKAKTEFLFSMSHDIRTPMNAILGYTDIGLRHVEDTERTRDSYMKIKSAGGHLLNLINDILEMSRIESGKIELAENPMDVRAASKNIQYMSESLATPKSIDLQISIGDLRNPYVYADELHISEIIINLISNAVKYTPEGGKVRYSVNQVSDATDGKVLYRFEVSDTGIGMSEEFQRHLFEAFSREQTTTVSKIEGTGLGLSIVKKIVDLTGGNIRVKSNQKEGSTFTVEIPFKVMDEEAIEKFREKNAIDEESWEDEISLEGKKVLLVEDNEMNRDIATEILEESGMIIETAEDGAIALKTVADKGMDYYDFILMDIQMPVMNGYEATRAIRALPGGDTIPIIALSANAFEEDRQKSLDEGMNAHVAKPINIKELFGVLAKYI